MTVKYPAQMGGNTQQEIDFIAAELASIEHGRSIVIEQLLSGTKSLEWCCGRLDLLHDMTVSKGRQLDALTRSL